MAETKRFLDVWIIETQQVYRRVPFTVVTDWLQEGRLLPEDRVRLVGTEPWHQIGKVRAFAPYLPRVEPHRPDDRAEALEPVAMGFNWKNPAEIDDEDVDMIPLIDISLVLLIFFMMTASVSSGVFSSIKTPAALHQLATPSKEMFWLGIDIKNRDGVIEKGPDGKPIPFYSLGLENKVLQPATRDLGEVVRNLQESIGPTGGEVRIRIRADETLPIETVTAATLELQGLQTRINQQRAKTASLQFAISGEVTEPKSK